MVQRSPKCRKGSGGGFTLLELMIVVGIMGIIMTMGVPLVYNIRHKEPMRKAVADVVEVCSNARARAILGGTVTEVIFYPRENRLQLAAGSPRPAGDGAQPDQGNQPLQAPIPAAPGSGLSAQLSDRLAIEMLDINLTEYRDADEAHVRFYPNGTCDEMTLILVSVEGDRREIKLEITTSLAMVESDVRKFK